MAKGKSGGGGTVIIVGVLVVAIAASQHHHHHHHHGPGASLMSDAARRLDPAPASVSGNAALGERMAAARGWTGSQWSCLDALWNRESGWSNTTENARSGAYGIAQALGHGPTNQYPAGPANPPQSDARAQISWGLRYIAVRYGTPCVAWNHETGWNWY